MYYVFIFYLNLKLRSTLKNYQFSGIFKFRNKMGFKIFYLRKFYV